MDLPWPLPVAAAAAAGSAAVVAERGAPAGAEGSTTAAAADDDASSDDDRDDEEGDDEYDDGRSHEQLEAELDDTKKQLLRLHELFEAEAKKRESLEAFRGEMSAPLLAVIRCTDRTRAAEAQRACRTDVRSSRGGAWRHRAPAQTQHICRHAAAAISGGNRTWSASAEALFQVQHVITNGPNGAFSTIPSDSDLAAPKSRTALRFDFASRRDRARAAHSAWAAAPPLKPSTFQHLHESGFAKTVK